VCRFHVTASEKLHANKFSGVIVRSVANRASTFGNLVLSPTGSINLGFTTEGRLAAVLIITFSWGFQLGGYIYNSYINTAPPTPFHKPLYTYPYGRSIDETTTQAATIIYPCSLRRSGHPLSSWYQILAFTR
jgi:hypothetical protein